MREEKCNKTFIQNDFSVKRDFCLEYFEVNFYLIFHFKVNFSEFYLIDYKQMLILLGL